MSKIFYFDTTPLLTALFVTQCQKVTKYQKIIFLLIAFNETKCHIYPPALPLSSFEETGREPEEKGVEKREERAGELFIDLEVDFVPGSPFFIFCVWFVLISLKLPVAPTWNVVLPRLLLLD